LAFLSEFLKNRRFTGWFSRSVASIFFFPKSCSVKTPGGRHHMETFMKLLIDFFLREKTSPTHFPAIFFNSKHYAEETLGIKG